MNESISAIVLAGGRSSRMGRNKLFLELDGLTFIDRIIRLLKPLFTEIMFISNTLEHFKSYQFKVYGDLFPFFGPLAGIHSGLTHSPTDYNFIISIDMPFVSTALINFLVDNVGEKPVTLPVAGNELQPLCGIYRKAVLPEIEKLLQNSTVNSSAQNGKINVKIYDLLNSVEVQKVNVGKEEFYHEYLFHNVNTYADYLKAVEIAGKLKTDI